VDVYNQISKVPLELNNQNTLIFLSTGGNDILFHYVDQEGDSTDSSVLKPMFSAYKKVVESIRIRLPNARLYLLDIYYPDNLKYKQYHSIINEWNQMIYDYANNPKNNISGVLKISSILTQGDDFAFGIEPSSKGGQKIAENILNT
jgi:lysophospholipase L1-like esterase